MAEALMYGEGEPIDPSALGNSRAMEIIAATMRSHDCAALIECRRSEAADIVVVDLKVDRPNQPVHDIRRIERIAFRIPLSPNVMPEALALRGDFPLVPHRNQGLVDRPVSLCLYDRPWMDVRLSWNGAQFLDRVRWWLRGTARGDLHAQDQSLEPLLLPGGIELVVPASFGINGEPQWQIARIALVGDVGGRVLVVVPSDWREFGGVETLVVFIQTPKRQHGVIQRTPSTFAELCALTGVDNFDLLAQLRQFCRDVPDELRHQDRRRDMKFILVLGFPKSRHAESEVEWVEYKGFLFDGLNLEEVGEQIGAWEVIDGNLGHVLSQSEDRNGESVPLHLVDVLQRMTRDRAAQCSGLGAVNRIKILAIGAGALGSQVAMNLARCGFGIWVIVDDDAMMPHNTVRHTLPGGWTVGVNKAIATAMWMNQVADDEPAASAIPANVLSPQQHQETIDAHLNDSEVILDMSASLSVCRWLSAKERTGRAMSLFLSPNGNDLVLLAEDEARSVRLDELEMLYYDAVTKMSDLEGHLGLPPGTVRYGGSCRDVSVQIAQSTVGTLAGIGAAAVRAAVDDDKAVVRVWRQNAKTLAVTAIDIDVNCFTTFTTNGWSVRINNALLSFLQSQREDYLPNETGGILIGAIDRLQQCIYLVSASSSPRDSIHWPHMYKRGVKGLLAERQRIVAATAGQLDYLGEWHSHPRKSSTRPSSDDAKVFAWIEELGVEEGRPPIMAICGDDGVRVFVKSLSDPLPEAICLQ